MCREQEEHKKEKIAGKKQNGKKKRERKEVLLNGLWGQTEKQVHIPALKVPNYTCHLNRELLRLSLIHI